MYLSFIFLFLIFNCKYVPDYNYLKVCIFLIFSKKYMEMKCMQLIKLNIIYLLKKKKKKRTSKKFITIIYFTSMYLLCTLFGTSTLCLDVIGYVNATSVKI